jgi:hypothetical protein
MSTNTSPTNSRRNSDADISGNRVKKFLNGWTKEQEQLMAEWSDIAACYRWLHDRAEKKFHKLNMGITIPVIILSTLTGAANFAVGSFIPPDNDALQGYVSASLGGLSIFAGILTTLGNFFQYAQRSESNRVASISWGKFQRLVQVELAINPMDRIEAMDFLKICRQDLDRLIEQSPQIPDDVIAQFEKEFKELPNLKRPDICHGIEHTRVFNSSKARLGQVAADAVLHLRYRKNILANSVMPDINKKIEDELTSRIEKRIKELLPSAPATPPPESHGDVTSIVTSLETDWRNLLMKKRVERAPRTHEETGTDDIRLNIVGVDGPPTVTPARSIVSGSPPPDMSSRRSENSVSSRVEEDAPPSKEGSVVSGTHIVESTVAFN